MKKVVLASIATLVFGMTVSAQVAPSVVETPASAEGSNVVVTESDNAESKSEPRIEVDYDATVLEGPNLLLPDSVRIERELQAMRELNPKDSLLEEKRLPEKRFFTIGGTAGLNTTTYSVVNLNGTTAGFGVGAQLGLNCDIPLGQTPLWQYFSLQPELILSFGTVPLNLKLPVTDDSGVREIGVVECDAMDWFVQTNVPVTLKGSIRMGKGRPFFALGPMFTLGLWGRRNSDNPEIYASSFLYQADPNLYDKDGEPLESRRETALYNNMDFSLYTKAGYDFDSGVSASVAFRLGFVNLLKDVDYGMLRARCIYFNVGYSF